MQASNHYADKAAVSDNEIRRPRHARQGNCVHKVHNNKLVICMKGFAKIFEAIIASIIVLASLTFFFVPATGVSRWDSTSLQVTADDVLQAVYLNGSLDRFVKTDNRTQLNSEVSGMLPKNVDFSIEVSGIPNDIIYVSCVDCPSSDELVAMLSPLNFQYKNRNISMRIDPLTLSSTSIPSETNILFFLDKQGIIDYHAKIDVFLNNGGSIFLLSDLTQSDVQGVIGNIFNLSWTGNTAQSAHFEDVFNPNKTSHYAARYYANLTNRTLESTASVNFPVDASGFHQNGVLANSDEKNIVVTNDQRAYARSNFTALNNKSNRQPCQGRNNVGQRREVQTGCHKKRTCADTCENRHICIRRRPVSGRINGVERFLLNFFFRKGKS